MGLIPCRRNCALAMAELAARISPLLVRPDLSVPFQVKRSFLVALLVAIILSPLCLLSPAFCFFTLVYRYSVGFFKAGQSLCHFLQGGCPQVIEALGHRLLVDLQGIALLHDDAGELGVIFTTS